MKIKKIKTLPLPYLPHFQLHALISLTPPSLSLRDSHKASITPSHTHQPPSVDICHRPPQLLHIPHSHTFTVMPNSLHSTQICLCCRLHMPAFTRRPPHAVLPTRLDLFILTVTTSLFNFLITLSLFCILGFV